MAMLAEPRQRKRYNLVPKGKALFEDGDRFGTKMLEKMGWSKGKGLGPREDGQQEFVRVRYKNDANGLGFEDRDDQWTEHEKHFTGLLDNLNSNSNTNSASDEGDAAPTVGFGFQTKSATKEKLKDKFSGQSLEEKSKNSKARVHYKKFTKGKDMSQYSEKDLANIFGKKATPDDVNIYSQFQAFGVIAGDNVGEKKEETSKKPVEIGTHIINTGVSVSDYFKQKMAALKDKKSDPVLNAAEEVENNSNDDVPMKKKKSKKRSAEIETDEVVPASEQADEVPEKKKKHKKQAKSTENTDHHLENNTTEAVLNESDIQADVPSKKKKSKKSSAIAKEKNVEEDPEESFPDVVNHNPSKKIKLSSKTAIDEQVDVQPITDEIPLKKKKNKKSPTEANEENLPPPTIPIKKKKSKKNSPEDESSSTQDSKSQDEPEASPSDTASAVNSNSEEKPKKKKKKNNSKPNPTEPTPVHEKFRNIEFHRFNDSTVSQISGYGLSEDLQLQIKSIKGDQERIMKLWSSTLDKYQYATPKHKIYKSYVLKVREARKSKSRVPKIKVKCLKRRHVFQGL